MQKQLPAKITKKEKKDSDDKVDFNCWNCNYGWKGVVIKDHTICPKCGSCKVTFRVM